MDTTRKGKRRAVTDSELREDVRAGLLQAEIASKRGITQQAVSDRLRKLGLSTQSRLVAPEESRRFIGSQLSAQEQLLKGLSKANLLMDACDEWLRDANDPERYDIGPREGEVTITYEVELRTDKGFRYEKRKKPLSEMLKWVEEVDGERVCGCQKWESKHADPRELILKTQQECRSTVQLMADLARMLADAKAMEMFRNAMLAEIAKVSPEVATAIADAVRRSIVLSAALDGSPGIPA